MVFFNSRPTPSWQRGFTLLEVLVVMVILGLAAAWVLPSLSLPARAPVPPMVEFLQQQQQQAMAKGRAITVFWQERQLRAEPSGDLLPLSADMYLELSRPEKTGYLDKQLVTVFYANGSAIAADFRVMVRPPNTVPRLAYAVTVNPFHGGIDYSVTP